MSEYRLRQGHHDPRNLWRYHIDETPESKSGMCVGRVDYASLAEEIVNAVNERRSARAHHDDPITNTIHSALMELHPDADKSNVTGDWQALRDDAEHIATRVRDAVRAEVEDLTHDYEEQYRRDQQDLMNATDREDDLRSGVWIMPGLKGGRACVGGTRVPAADVADLMANGVGADQISRYYPSVTTDGAAAAHYFAGRYVDRRDTDSDLAAAKSFTWTTHGGSVVRVTRVSDTSDGWVVDLEDQTVATGLDRESALARARELVQERPAEGDCPHDGDLMEHKELDKPNRTVWCKECGATVRTEGGEQ